MTIEEMRNELIKRIPEMKSEIETAPDAAIEIAYALSKLPKEIRNIVADELGSMIENQENEKEAHECI